MAPPSDSPEITIRENAAPPPTFAGLALPTALRELHSKTENTCTPRPSEMSALAVRFRKIQLDLSPADNASPTKRAEVKPAQLEFEDVGLGKENVCMEDARATGPSVRGLAEGDLATKRDVVHSKNGAIEKEEASCSVESCQRRNSDRQGERNAGIPPAACEGDLTDGQTMNSESKELRTRFSYADQDLDGRDESDSKHSRTAREVGTGFSAQSDNQVEALSPEVALHGSRACKVKSAAPDEEKGQSTRLECTRDSTEGFLEQSLQRVLQGKEKWTWLERCEAMSAIEKTLNGNPSPTFHARIKSVLPTLSSKLNDHLDELRPSVITSALGLVNAFISRFADDGICLAKDVFPSIMDLACGRSLTAQDAAKSLALVMHAFPSLSPTLEDADNPERLCEVLEQISATSRVPEDIREKVAQALEVAKTMFGYPAKASAQGALRTPPHARVHGGSSPLPSLVESPKSDARDFGPLNETAHGTTTPQQGKLYGRLTSRSARSSVRNAHRTLSRTSSNDTPKPSGTCSSPPDPDESVEVRSGASAFRNMKLGESVRKVSPGSLRNKRVYTEEDVDEIRRSAMQVATEEASRAHEKEHQELQNIKDELERKLQAERSEVIDLKSVLEEYQMTMQTMVAKGNSQASAQHSALMNEKKRLKAELLELSESFEALKERYDTSKETIAMFETKEGRLIDQIKDLKKNMVELQKWSNDLKANTEKKLSKAFESVTSFRASYIDKEAHAKKALCDLEKTRSELEKAQQNHADAAAKVAQVEAQLHVEQDARSSADKSLATSKTLLSRMTSQKERLHKELLAAQDELSTAKARLEELEQAESRVAEVKKQFEGITKENQSLKARAYDDMTRIRSLESEVKDKEAEIEEMSAICEEAVERLEHAKLGAK